MNLSVLLECWYSRILIFTSLEISCLNANLLMYEKSPRLLRWFCCWPTVLYVQYIKTRSRCTSRSLGALIKSLHQNKSNYFSSFFGQGQKSSVPASRQGKGILRPWWPAKCCCEEGEAGKSDSCVCTEKQKESSHAQPHQSCQLAEKWQIWQFSKAIPFFEGCFFTAWHY